jgi:hypothetical protein
MNITKSGQLWCTNTLYIGQSGQTMVSRTLTLQIKLNGGPSQTRTGDLTIMSRML